MLALALQPAAEGPQLRITSPREGFPLFGRIELAVEVDPSLDIESVEFFLDGLRVGSVSEPPYRLSVDVGQVNEAHWLEVRARHGAGELAQSLVSPVFRVDQEITTELRQLYVTVLEADRLVIGLPQSLFSVFEDGERQELVTFGGEVRLQAAILVDSSASMKRGRLEFALRGASEFMEGLRPEDEASIVLFSDRLLRVTPFSNEPAVALESLVGVEAGGGTALSDHLYMAFKLLERRLGRRVLLLLSDGFDTHSALQMEEVHWLAQRSRSTLYWIRMGAKSSTGSRYSAWKGPEDYWRDVRFLERTVNESGGRVVPLERIEDIDEVLRQILDELRGQYVLGYHPKTVRKDGSWHKIEVRVRLPGTTVRTRGGYLDF